MSDPQAHSGASSLGTLDELPQDYRDAMTSANLVPLWPSMRGFLPHDAPRPQTRPALWRYSEVRPLLLRAGSLTPIEKAERRVLVFSNPGHGLDGLHCTGTIYVGMQMILPGEIAPNHRHTPSAVRLVVEGEGGSTIVNGERLPMERGDLILTPALQWHEHTHAGSGPVIWMDALDLPLVVGMEASYALEGASQTVKNGLDASVTRYRRAGLVPYQNFASPRAQYPLMRWPWAEVRAALEALASDTDEGKPVHLGYVNPETGGECLPTLGFSAIMLRSGEEVTLPRDSASAVFHVVSGTVQAEVAGEALLNAEDADVFAAPAHARVRLVNRSTAKPAFLFQIDDAPLQRKIGIYERFDA
ncbi:cupin domain-containing protein [Roseomonas sp. KE2513]|uniref:cupin domain-containing protein n=1 Tax=Roseomonas sp. KE2513 TaxID=2479202 RepID=UPI0018DF236D|nr:cupin domain-containing protein [Roseomonas sp. KE2513]MBI0538793.1 cupin domain-containing protein [Roseomonas sp. KE2513]